MMNVIEAGHIYDLAWFDGVPNVNENRLTFVNREKGTEHGGTQTQEVLRVLIDRTRHCHNCLPDEVNEKIIYHLRMAIAYHEGRALRRKIQKDNYEIEYASLGPDGHMRAVQRSFKELETTSILEK